MALLCDERGAPFCGKPEGIAADPTDDGLLWLVVDADDPRVPSELLRVRVTERG
jgi:hypothetical protein